MRHLRSVPLLVAALTASAIISGCGNGPSTTAAPQGATAPPPVSSTVAAAGAGSEYCPAEAELSQFNNTVKQSGGLPTAADIEQTKALYARVVAAAPAEIKTAEQTLAGAYNHLADQPTPEAIKAALQQMASNQDVLHAGAQVANYTLHHCITP